MAKKQIKKGVLIAKEEGIKFEVEGSTVIIKGKKGENTRKFTNPNIDFKVTEEGIEIISRTKKSEKKSKMYLHTYESHIKNMIKGVKEGFTYKLKICSGHFPMNVVVQGGEVIIKNFFGEKVPRRARISKGVIVKVVGDEIIVEGIDKEFVSQTAARIEQSTRITNRDRRIFQDGCYIIEKAGKVISEA